MQILNCESSGKQEQDYDYNLNKNCPPAISLECLLYHCLREVAGGVEVCPIYQAPVKVLDRTQMNVSAL